MKSNTKTKPIILITNDDGIQAKGLAALVEAVKGFGDIYVVAPDEGQSGMSHAITVKHPLYLKKTKTFDEVKSYTCSGTPVDCVKLAFNQVLPRRPDFVFSGINHGSNASTSVLYSGTMGAALEACVNQIPAIGFSLLSHSSDADFEVATKFASDIARTVINNGLPENVCLNVNIPYVSMNEMKGVKVCRQNIGYWREEFEKRTDPRGKDYYWLTGDYHNIEPEANDTDEWALKNNYISIVPTQIDLTAHKCINSLEQLNFIPAFNLQ